MRAILFVVALTLGVSVGTLAIAGPPSFRQSTEFNAESPHALVVFEVAPSFAPSSKLELYAFDPATREWTYTMTRGWADFGRLRGSGFHAGLVRPAGVYAINSVATQSYWVACFNGGTFAFNLQPGSVNYIGMIDVGDALAQVAAELPHTSRGAIFTLYDTPRIGYRPAATQPDWESRVRSYLAGQYPNVNAPIVAPEPLAVTFEPGTSLITGRTCGKW